jgi:serine-type D-Ala-D-Ala carboxypeptidase/endopeptidase (penicillin-binding protein 4)
VTVRRRVVLRVVAVLCAVAAVVCVTVGLRDNRPALASVTQASASHAATPLWSPRRTPALFVDEAAKARLSRQLVQLVAPYAACAIVETPSNRRIASAGNDGGLAPASNQKLLTATTALEVLGPNRRLVTDAAATSPVVNGTLSGDLFLIGGGDPLLVTPGYQQLRQRTPRYGNTPVTPLADLANAIVAAGVHHISGAIVADDSRYDSLRYLPDWKPSYIRDGEIGPLGALTVDGGFIDPRRPIAAPDPAALTAQRLQELLATAGVTVDGGARHGTAPTGARSVAHVSSPTVGTLVDEMLTASDNYTAELLTREIGFVGAHAGTTAAGIDTIMRTVRRLGVPTAGFALHDGSGLAPSDRVTCDALAHVLSLMRAKPFDDIDRGLPIAGRTGTLAERFVGDPLAGVLRAKTGEIEGAVGLSGVLDDGQHLHFAFLANGPFSTDGGRVLQADVAHIVASYPDLGTVGGVDPLPQPAIHNLASG